MLFIDTTQKPKPENPRFPRSTEKNEYILVVKLFKNIMQSIENNLFCI